MGTTHTKPITLIVQLIQNLQHCLSNSYETFNVNIAAKQQESAGVSYL